MPELQDMSFFIYKYYLIIVISYFSDANIAIIIQIRTNKPIFFLK